MRSLYIVISLLVLVACDSDSANTAVPNSQLPDSRDEGTPADSRDEHTTPAPVLRDSHLEPVVFTEPDTTPIPPPADPPVVMIGKLDLEMNYHSDYELVPPVCSEDSICYQPAYGSDSHFVYSKDNGESFPVDETSVIDDLGNSTIVRSRADQSMFVYHLQVGSPVENASLRLHVDNAKSYGVFSHVSDDVHVQITPSVEYPAPVVEFSSDNRSCLINNGICEVALTTQHFSSDFYKRYAGYILARVSGEDSYVVFKRPINLADSYYEGINLSVDLRELGGISVLLDKQVELRLIVTDNVLNTTDTHKRLHELPGVAYVSAPLKLLVMTTQ